MGFGGILGNLLGVSVYGTEEDDSASAVQDG